MENEKWQAVAMIKVENNQVKVLAIDGNSVEAISRLTRFIEDGKIKTDMPNEGQTMMIRYQLK